MKHFKRVNLLRSFLAAVLAGTIGMEPMPARADGPGSVRVLSFNLWHGGDAGKQPLDATVEVIRQSRADVVGLQETAGMAPEGEDRPDRAAEIAERLGWHYLDQGGRTGIISRFPIVGSTPKKWGAKLALPSGRQLYAFNVHLAHAPYQPYQLLRIPYGDGAFLATEDEAVRAAQEARGAQIAEMLAEAAAVAAEGLPMVVTGDFNEPSHRDWTEVAASAGHHPTKVEWPSTLAVESAGFVDAYRRLHPDPVARRGVTWTPLTSPDDPKDHHDRIDFVFATPDMQVKSAEIVGESREAADIVVTPYPSDHRAVVADLELPAGASSASGG